MNQPVCFRLNGGQAALMLNIDGSCDLRVVYQLGFGVQLPPGTTIVVEEKLKPDRTNDRLQQELAALAEKWKAGDVGPAP